MSQKNCALLQVVGHDDEQHAFRAKDAARFGDELARGVDARHVLEHLIGVHDICARVDCGNRRRPRMDDVEPFSRQLIGQHAARFDAVIAPAGSNRGSRETAMARTNLEHVARRPRVLHQQAEARFLDALAARRTGASEFSLRKPSIERVGHQCMK